MGKSLKEKLDALPEARRDRILAEADRLRTEYLALQELRKAKKLIQTQLAEILDIHEVTIAQMGGKLSLTVEFPDRAPVSLEGFSDTEEPPRKRPTENASPA